MEVYPKLQATALRLALGLLASALPAAAQFTQVTATVTDPNGLAYANASGQAQLVPPGGTSPTVTGVAFSGLQKFSLDSTGSFTLRLADNSQVSPAGTQWQFTICANAGPPPLGIGPVCFSSTMTISGASQNISTTLNAAAPSLTNIGKGNLTYTGNNTHSGAETFGSINKALHVNAAGPYTTIALALAACPAAPSGCHIIVDDGVSLTAVPAFTLGVSPCQNNFAQVLEIGVNGSVTLSGQVKLLCGGYIFPGNRDGSIITAGAGFPTNTPMVDMGDNVNSIDARVEGVTLDCGSITGCTNIRARGLNENSIIARNLIKNYLTNGLLLDGTTIFTGNFKVDDNQFTTLVAASDAVSAVNVQNVMFLRNTEVSNVQQTSAGLHFSGTANAGAINTIGGDHCEKMTDCILLDGNTGLIIISITGTNGNVNAVHVNIGATGSVSALSLAGGTNPINNAVTGTVIATASAPNGIVYGYGWQSSTGLEWWTDTAGFHSQAPLLPNAAGTRSIGSNALPWNQICLGPSATNSTCINSNSTGGASSLNFSPTVAGQVTQLLIPNVASDTITLVAAAQTLASKTLISPALTTPTIGGGTPLTVYRRISVTLSPVAVAANTCAAQSFTVTGLVAADILIGVNKPTEQAGLSVTPGHVTAVNTATLNFCNNTAVSITPTAGETYSFAAVQ